MAGVDEDADISSICLQAGQALSEQVEASICVVELNLHDAEVEEAAVSGGREADPQSFGSLRALAHQVSTNLWHVSSPAFMGEQNGISARWLRARLADLRLEFDYAVLHGPPAGIFSETALMGSLTDGIVLVLEADSTRRVVAQKTRDALYAANVRILGAVLNDRTFPIPSSIYDRL
jgi:MinD-like ATPase involved in chromosome partitioning or flagellar assembly